VLNLVLIRLINWNSRLKIQATTVDNVIKKMKLNPNTSFFWSGPLEEKQLFLHILLLVIVSSFVVYHPLASFASLYLSLNVFIVAHLCYTGLTIIASLLVFDLDYELYQVKSLLDHNYCDTLDQATYTRERASLYAKVKHDIYLCYLTSGTKESLPQPVVSAPDSKQQSS
jgi:hypothetical protein